MWTYHADATVAAHVLFSRHQLLLFFIAHTKRVLQLVFLGISDQGNWLSPTLLHLTVIIVFRCLRLGQALLDHAIQRFFFLLLGLEPGELLVKLFLVFDLGEFLSPLGVVEVWVLLLLFLLFA